MQKKPIRFITHQFTHNIMGEGLSYSSVLHSAENQYKRLKDMRIVDYKVIKLYYIKDNKTGEVKELKKKMKLFSSSNDLYQDESNLC
ncbi:MAG: hypothetical protein ABI045_03410 [Flavobacteriales bacterium]